MYLHLGNDVVINMKNIVGIFDIENTSISQHTKSFLNKATKADKIINVSYEMPKTFIVTINEKSDEIIYISQISASTLRKRAILMENAQDCL